ncbi:MAG TPA: hypothetical protein VFX89_21595 [Gammaproteobacteria bacterium]|nr:hypothetical protein [Gammaproteobacteria bacterium]
MGFWERVRSHKIIQWAIGYVGAALALAQGFDVVAHAFDWPSTVTRVVLIGLLIGFPIAITVAWYHGHRGLQRVSAGELAIVATLVLVGAVLFTFAVPKNGAPAAAATASATPASLAPPAAERPLLPNSVAVLPLENLSGDADSERYARGLHAAIISQLTKLSNIRVINRDSVLQYVSPRPPPARISLELGAQSLLIGTFQSAGSQIRIAMELVDPKTGTNLWSDEYGGEITEFFDVQSDISMNVANAMAVEFSRAERESIERRPTSSPEAYALYLQATGSVEDGTPGASEAAQALLDRALALDPRFAGAYGGKAQAWVTAFTNTGIANAVAPGERAALEQHIRDYAGRALAIDPTESSARAALRTIDVITWHWSAFGDSLLPVDEGGLSQFQVWTLTWIGRADALRVAQRVVELNPRSLSAYLGLGVTQAYAGDLAASTQTFRRGRELAPGNGVIGAWLAYNQIAAGNPAAALDELRSLEQFLGSEPPVVFFPELAYAYSRLGRPDDARRLYRELETRAKDANVGDGAWAMAYWAIGDKARTLEALGALAAKARNHEPDAGLLNAMNLKQDFLRDPALRDDPDLQAALSRVRGD